MAKKKDVLVVVESEAGKKFGGFTSLQMLDDIDNNNKWQKDPKAFVFSLSNKTKHKVKPECGIHQGSYNLLLFGTDIYLFNDGN
jgi:hypothetical protein